jgi:hypothetical protein
MATDLWPVLVLEQRASLLLNFLLPPTHLHRVIAERLADLVDRPTPWQALQAHLRPTLDTTSACCPGNGGFAAPTRLAAETVAASGHQHLNCWLLTKHTESVYISHEVTGRHVNAIVVADR